MKPILHRHCPPDVTCVTVPCATPLDAPPLSHLRVTMHMVSGGVTALGGALRCALRICAAGRVAIQMHTAHQSRRLREHIISNACRDATKRFGEPIYNILTLM